MKLSKARLRQIIKEEINSTVRENFSDLFARADRDEVIEEPASAPVYIISEPSMTYGGEGTEIKLLGVYLDISAAKAALESHRSEFPATTAEVSAVPANKIDRYGYTA